MSPGWRAGLRVCTVSTMERTKEHKEGRKQVRKEWQGLTPWRSKWTIRKAVSTDVRILSVHFLLPAGAQDSRASFSHTVLSNFRHPRARKEARGIGPKQQICALKWGHRVPGLKGHITGAFSLRDSEGIPSLWIGFPSSGRKAKDVPRVLRQVAFVVVFRRLLRGSVYIESKPYLIVKLVTFSLFSTVCLQCSPAPESRDGQCAKTESHDAETWILTHILECGRGPYRLKDIKYYSVVGKTYP